MKPTTVIVIASVHGLHEDHPTYDYDRLFQAVADFDPDYVGVEIRPEDLWAERSELAPYPLEMIELSRRYGEERCFGFDWLGDDIAGRPVPSRDGTEGRAVNHLERELDADPDLHGDVLNDLLARQMAIAETATLASLNDGRYGAVTQRYYELRDAAVRGTRYEPVAEFRRRRDEQIGRNIVRFVRDHPGTRIVLVMGANHRVFALEALEAHFGDDELVLVTPGAEPQPPRRRHA